MAKSSFEGQTLGKYRILEPLGHGGMAWVYRAYHPQLDRYVAVKLLRSDLVEDEEFLARFQREARAVANLRHPHIVQVFDFDVHDDAYYMVMEYLQGDTLTARLNGYRVQGSLMPLGEVVRVMLDVLDGLAYAHSEGMIHRDLKPSNILLTKKGQAVVGDFGIAHMVGGTRHTATGALMGTPEYMAPEQGLRGQCDARSDVYSLGVILYEMLTQHVPFAAETPLAILMKHVNDPLPLPREANPDIPIAFERVVLKAMAKQPDDRYAGAQAMAEALAAAAAEAGVEMPTRISFPLSFSTPQAPSESVAVISGPTKRVGLDPQVAEADTDVHLGRRLNNAIADATPPPAPATPDEPVLLQHDPTHDAAVISPKTEETAAPATPHALKILAMTLGVAVIGNLLAIMTSAILDNWAIFSRGWSFELFLAGGALFILMALTRKIWLSVPAGIATATGILLAYCSFTLNWHHWGFLWIVEAWVVAATIVISRQLSKQPAHAHTISRLLGWSIGLTSLLGAVAVQGAALVSGIMADLFG